MGVMELLPETKLSDQLPVLVGIRLLEIVQQFAALADHFQESAARMVILHMRFEMIGKAVDPGGQKRDLNFRGAGVAGYALVLRYDLRFLRNGH